MGGGVYLVKCFNKLELFEIYLSQNIPDLYEEGYNALKVLGDEIYILKVK